MIWRGRPLRAAWPVAIAVLAAVPFLLADLRLAERATVSPAGSSLASPREAWAELVAATSSFAGGDGLPLLFFTALALLGLGLLARRDPAVAALALSFALPPLLFMVVRTESAADLSPRHLFYGLPLWAAAIGVGTSRLPRLAPVFVVLIAVTSPASALHDPREIGFATASTEEAPPIHARENDLLLPYSAVFLARLSDVREALALPHGPEDELLAVLEHAEVPIGAVYLAVPTRPWTVRRLEGPFDQAEALDAACNAVRGYDAPALAEWQMWIERGLCGALRRYTAAPWQANESSWTYRSARRTDPPHRGDCGARV